MKIIRKYAVATTVAAMLACTALPATAKAEAAAERRKVESGLDSKLKEAEARIALIKDTALSDVGTIAEETAAAIVQELVGGKVDKASLSAAVKAVQQQ